MVVATSFEEARAAATVRIDYDAETGAFDLAKVMDSAVKPDDSEKPDTAVGNFEEAFDVAPVVLDAWYTTPDQTHAMMEPRFGRFLERW